MRKEKKKTGKKLKKMNKDWDCLGINILEKYKNKKWIKSRNYFKIYIVKHYIKNLLHILII